MASPLYAYCHGFLSGPGSSKGKHLQRLLGQHGIALRLLDLNGHGGPASLTPERALATIHALWTSQVQSAPMRLLGSSFGGWAAARYAELHPDRVDRMLLLAPAFEFATRWPAIIGVEELRRWQKEGAREFSMPSDGSSVMVPWSFAKAVEHSIGSEPPRIIVPTIIIHGSKDEVLLVEASERAVGQSDGAGTLVIVDDDHALTAPATLLEIERQAQRFFSLPQRRT
mmetsp:Transcript_2261/g.7214  ORF Transcript_2261/g.7214 Transcript_2261/m.7214 type:complete len:227 (+) Transcript_2261:273-953(+)